MDDKAQFAESEEKSASGFEGTEQLLRSITGATGCFACFLAGWEFAGVLDSWIPVLLACALSVSWLVALDRLVAPR